MAVTLVVRSGASDRPGLSFDAPRVVIGRSEGCEVRLPDPSVSQRHASIRQRGADYLIQDEGSTNGTFVGPVRLSPGAPRLLRTGDRIRVGRVWLDVRIESVAVPPNPALATKELALALVAEALSAEGEPAAPRLQVVEGSHRGKHLELVESDRAYVIGRGKNVDLSLDDTDLSRRHAQITRRGDRLFVKDLGSKNGTQFDDEPVSAEREVPWPANKRLRVGSHTVEYEDPVRDALVALERAPDERVAAGEVLDEAPPSAPEPRPEEGSKAPRPAVPSPAVSPPRSAAKGRVTPPGWTGTDYLVAVAAVIVLGLSLAAVVWLIQSG
jgi:pSer/pThr/pTyr-binding forkhead associated (FHA) protein